MKLTEKLKQYLTDKRSQSDVRIIINLLKKLEYFSQLSDKTNLKLFNNVIEGFARQSTLETYEHGIFQIKWKGQLIYKQGDRPDKFMILIDGACLALHLKDQNSIDQLQQDFETKYPDIDSTQNFALSLWNYAEGLQVKQVQGGRSNTRANSLSRSSLDMGSSVRLRQTSRQKTDSNIMLDKVQILPPEYLEELSKEVMICFKGHHVQMDTTNTQSLFLGPIFKFYAGQQYHEGQNLTSELVRSESSSRKLESTLVSLSRCHVLIISVRQYDELMKSLEKAKIAKTVNQLMKGLDGGVRSSDLRIILKELVKHAPKHKICNGQKIYSQGAQLNSIYVVVKGEFSIIKEFQLNKETKPPLLPSDYDQKDSLFHLFVKQQLLERKQAQMLKEQKEKPQEKPRKRSKTTDEPLNHQPLPEKILNQEIGRENYEFMSELYKLRQRIDKDPKKYKPVWRMEYVLSKKGPGQLIGDEDFPIDQNVSKHSFTAQCISSEGKVIEIKRQDISRLCNQYEWFAQIFFHRAQSKIDWLRQRFQEMLARDLKQQISEIDPTQQYIQSVRMQKSKDPDQSTLDQYAELVKTSKFRDDMSVEEKVNKKIEIQQNKKQYLPKDEPLNVQELHNDSPRKYTRNLQRILDKKGLSRESSVELFEKGVLPKELTHTFLRGMSPVQGQENPSITINVDEKKTMKHQAAEMIRNNVQKIFSHSKSSSADMKNKTIHNDIGLIEYLVSTDQTQLRLQHHILNKNNRKKKIEPQMDPQPLLGQDLERNIDYFPQQFVKFSTLLYHVTKQHYSKVVQDEIDSKEFDQNPISVRQLSGEKRGMKKEMTTQTLQQNDSARQINSFRLTASSTINSSTGKFTQGVLNRVRIRQNIQQSRSFLRSQSSRKREKIPLGSQIYYDQQNLIEKGINISQFEVAQTDRLPHNVIYNDSKIKN